MAGAEKSQLFRVLLFEGGEEGCAQRLEVVAQLGRFLQHNVKPVGREGSIDIVEHTRDIDAGSDCSDKQPRIDFWFEYGQRALYSFDVHAMANLEQPIGDRVPITEQIVVGGDAEVLHRQRRNALSFVSEGWGHRGCEETLDLNLCVGETVQSRHIVKSVEGLNPGYRPGGNVLGTRTENL